MELNVTKGKRFPMICTPKCVLILCPLCPLSHFLSFAYHDHFETELFDACRNVVRNGNFSKKNLVLVVFSNAWRLVS